MTLRSRCVVTASSLLVAAAALATAAPTPTPTPRPTLGGGFGRTEVTPVSPGSTGQTLADVVRAASAAKRRRETPRPAVSITNQSLVTDPNRGKLTLSQPSTRPTANSRSAAGGKPAPAPSPAAPATVATDAPDLPGEAGSSRGEAEWREIARQARRRVDDDRARVAQLESEAKKLENDFYAWDDGQYRDNVIKPAWDRKREEIETARRELAQAEADLADLPERARKGGALPGWIRE